MPAVDRETGKVLLAEPGTMSPSAPTATAARLPRWRRRARTARRAASTRCGERGIRTLFYFQVDNPLVQIADPAFLGLHRQADAEMSFKVIEKLAPDEKLGVVVTVDGRPQVIEYSDLPPELAERREPEGRLELWAGSIAIHLFERVVHRAARRRTSAPLPPRDQESARTSMSAASWSSPPSPTP